MGHLRDEGLIVPIYYMVCPNPSCPRLGTTERWLTPRTEFANDQVRYPCKECGARMERRPSGPGVSLIQHLDNGAMARAVDRPDGMAELLEEESRAREGGGRG